MKRTIGLLSLSVAVVLLLGWMLTIPALQINAIHGVPIVADGTSPTPPAPFSLTDRNTVADGTSPTPPAPFSQGVTLADGTSPTPPAPFSETDEITVADGTSPTPPAPFSQMTTELAA